MSRAGASRRTIVLGAAAAAAGVIVGRATGTSAALASPRPTAPLPPLEQAASATRPAERVGRPGTIMFPMETEPRCDILESFGDPRSGGRSHEGADLLATLGQDVYAVVDGTLTSQADADSSLSGNAWGLTSDLDGTYYFYAHLSGFAEGLRVGSRVRQGDVIGYVGDTGNPGAGNYHLHFEVHPGGQRNAAVDPLPLLQIPTRCSIT